MWSAARPITLPPKLKVALPVATATPGATVNARTLNDLGCTVRVNESAMERYTPRQRDRTLEDLRYIVEFIAAAEYVEDSTIFTEFLGWLDEGLRSRKVPRVAQRLGLDTVISEVVAADPSGGRLVREGLGYLANLG